MNYQEMSVTQIQILALETKSEIKRIFNLKEFLSPYYSEKDYPILAIQEYLNRLVNKQYALGKYL